MPDSPTPKPLRRDELQVFLKTPQAIRTFERMMTSVLVEMPEIIDGLIPASILTTRGDLIVRGASGIQRLGLGAAGRVLRSNGTDPLWAQLTSSDLSNFDEAAQDAVGAALSSTATVSLTYTDATPAVTADVVTDSISNTLLANMAQATIKGRAAGAGTGDPTDLTAAQVAAIIATEVAAALNITSGLYTPTLTIVGNLDAVTASQCQYLRIGSVVTVSGRFQADPTLNTTATHFGMSLPIASNFGAPEDLGGVASNHDVSGNVANISADTVNDRAQVRWLSNDTANRTYYFVLQYRVI